MLKLIWKFLRSGILDKDIYIETTEGAPQGGPLSPILANIYLNKLTESWKEEDIASLDMRMTSSSMLRASGLVKG